jgi:DNA-binding MarR family transcriptional regulator
MGPTNSLIYLVQHLSGVISKQVDTVLQEELGIGLSQYKILMVLEWNPRVQQKTIADSLGQTEASVSRQIKLLETKGMITSRPDPQNRRKHITVPSVVGMQITEAASNCIRRSFGPEFSAMGDEQMASLLTGLQQLHDNFCKPGKLGACDHPLGL